MPAMVKQTNNYPFTKLNKTKTKVIHMVLAIKTILVDIRKDVNYQNQERINQRLLIHNNNQIIKIMFNQDKEYNKVFQIINNNKLIHCKHKCQDHLVMNNKQEYPLFQQYKTIMKNKLLRNNDIFTFNIILLANIIISKNNFTHIY